MQTLINQNRESNFGNLNGICPGKRNFGKEQCKKKYNVEQKMTQIGLYGI